MKQIAKLMSLLVGTLCLMLLPRATALNANAATTLLLRYSSDGHWSYQVGSTWDTTNDGRDIYYLAEDGYLTDGVDAVIVPSEDESAVTKTELTLNVNLSSLTFSPGAFAVVHAASVTNCYICIGTTGVVNGNVTNAYLYDDSTGQFNGNVTNMYVLPTEYDFHTNVDCTGTVDYLKIDCDASNGKMVEYYNFKANTLEISDGTLTTDSSNYSTSPSGSSQSTGAGSQQTTAADSQHTAATDSQQAATASGEYDDVPKTGESQTAVPLLIGVAFVCMMGSLWLKKRAAHNA